MTHFKGPFRPGDSVLLIDRKERQYLRTLEPGKTVSIRGGRMPSDNIIGLEEGSLVRSSVNEPFFVFRPTLAQLIPNLPRKAQVIYPKDLGLILVWGDIFPGATVVEAGVGPGALTLALIRGVGASGRVISYEIREDFAVLAQKNIERFYGHAEHWTLKVKDIYADFEETDVDRILLDLPEPWRLVEKSWTALRPGGILLCYVPTVLQFKTLVDALQEHKGYACIETMENLVRFWHIQGLSVRPQHRMVAHTGFITIARRKADG